MNGNVFEGNFTLFLKIANERKTGSLYVKKGDALRILYFLNGKFAYAHSNLKGERLLDVISSSGLLADEYIEDVVNNLVPGESLGKIFVDRGYLTPMQLTKLVEAQQKKIFFSVLFLKDGEFRFFEEDLPTNIAPLNMEIVELIKEGIYQCKDRVIIATLMGNLDTVFKRAESEYNDFIAEKEKEFLKNLEEKSSLYELIRKSNYDEFETLKILLFLKIVGAIEEYKEEADFSDVAFGEEEMEEIEDSDLPIFSPEDEEIDKVFKDIQGEDIEEEKIKVLEDTNDVSSEEEDSKIFRSHLDEDKELKFKKVLIVLGIVVLAIIIGAIFYLKSRLVSMDTEEKPPQKVINIEREKVKPVVDKGFEKEYKKAEEMGQEQIVKKDEENISKKENKVKVKMETQNKNAPQKSKELEHGPQNNENMSSKVKKTEKPRKPIIENKIVNRSSLPDYSSLIRKSKFSLAANKYEKAISQINAEYSILLEVDCLLDSVKNAFIKASFSKKIFIINRKVKGKRCYAVFWGLYKTQNEALKDLKNVPSFFKSQNPRPTVIRIKAFLKK